MHTWDAKTLLYHALHFPMSFVWHLSGHRSSRMTTTVVLRKQWDPPFGGSVGLLIRGQS